MRKMCALVLLGAMVAGFEAAAQDAPPALREELRETKRLANRAMRRGAAHLTKSAG